MEEERARENILLQPSVSAFLDDKNMACQSEKRGENVCMCEKEKDAESIQGAGVRKDH